MAFCSRPLGQHVDPWGRILPDENTLVYGTDYGEGTSKPCGLKLGQLMLAFFACDTWNAGGTDTGERPLQNRLPRMARSCLMTPPRWDWVNPTDPAGYVFSVDVAAVVKVDGLWYPNFVLQYQGGDTLITSTPYTGTVNFFGVTTTIGFFDSHHVGVSLHVGRGQLFDDL